MATNILMPALSPTMEEGKLAKWLVKEGDTVKSGDILAEIETDKATMEFEAVDEGTIGKLSVAAGTEGVKVGTVIATLVADGEDADAAPTKKEAPRAEPKKEDAPKAEPKKEEPKAEAKAEAERLSDEVKTLQAERKQVRSRIEKLLGQIDQLSAS